MSNLRSQIRRTGRRFLRFLDRLSDLNANASMWQTLGSLPPSCCGPLRRSNRRREGRLWVLRLESLEPRDLLAAGTIDFDPNTGIVTAVGTESIDSFYALPWNGEDIVFVLETDGSQTEIVSRALVSQIEFDALGGDDVFWNGTDIASNVNAGAGADVLYGGSAADGLIGGAGDDVITGGDGDDVIDGGTGNDNLVGDAGADVMIGGAGADTLYGGTGDDVLAGGDDSDAVFGNAGDDWLFGGLGDDFLYGEADTDYINGQAGNDWIEGGSGGDSLYGGSGNDTLDGQLGNDLLSGDDHDDTLLGGDGDDRLFGGSGDDLLSGEAGADHLIGDAGNDEILGGDGGDLAYGLGGDDSIVGGNGADALFGGDGVDLIYGDDDRDILIGGGGADDLSGGGGEDVLIGGQTDYDDYSAVGQVEYLLSVWTGSDSYAVRIAALEHQQQPAYLQSTVTMHDDLVADSLRGQDDQDWFALTGNFDSGLFNSPVGGTSPQYGSFWQPLSQLDDLTDLQDDESIHTIVPHPRNREMSQSHIALFDLVNATTITHAAINSGAWSDPATWQGGQVPAAGAHVRIEPSVTVTVDGVLADPLEAILVGGVLDFDPSQDTHLRVDTLIIAPQGRLQIGSAAVPISAGVEARISIIDDGPVDPLIDPLALGRGIVSHGPVEMHGAAITPWVGLSVAPQAGQTELMLGQVPLNWNVGDTLLLPGTNPLADEDELLTIEAIVGSAVTVAPITYDHVPPDPALPVQLANLTRNIVIESENTTTDRRGHLMFMHQRDVTVSYAAVQDLGRTDKQVLADNPIIDASGNVQPGTGTNPRGRYALHFHRNGVINDGNPATVHGSVVSGSPGWGFVNHSSFVEFTDNVAYDAVGSAFVTEAGDEIGSFIGNLAVRGTGSGDTLSSRNLDQDFAHQGDGFWFQGAGVHVEDNVATGQAGHGFIFFTLGLLEPGLGVRQFLSSNLADPSIAGGAPTISVHDVPIQEFRNNSVYASEIGVGVLFSLLSADHGQGSVIEDITAWNNRTGIDLPYTANMLVRDVTVIHYDPLIGETGIDSNDVTGSVTYENANVDGYLIGLRAPARGTNIIDGGTFRNVVNVLVDTATDVRNLTITGAIDFQGWVSPQFGFDVWMIPNLSLTQNTTDLQHVFLSDMVLLDYGSYSNQQVFFQEQTAEFVPFPQDEPGVLNEWIGLTGQELFNQFGLRLGDAWVPSDAVTNNRIVGLIAQSA